MNDNHNDQRAGRATSAIVGFGVGTGVSEALKVPNNVKLGVGMGAAGLFRCIFTRN